MWMILATFFFNVGNSSFNGKCPARKTLKWNDKLDELVVLGKCVKLGTIVAQNEQTPSFEYV